MKNKKEKENLIEEIAPETQEQAVVENVPAAEEVVSATQSAEEATQVNAEETVTEETATEEDIHGENLHDKVKVLSPMATVAKRFFRSKLSVIGLVTIILLFLFSFVGPLFSPWAANGGTVLDTNPDLIKEILATKPVSYEVGGVTYEALAVSARLPEVVKLGDISASHWMGTDNFGYDVLTRLMYGGRISLTIGFVVVIIETVIGVIMGSLAGYFGKWVDNLIMRIVDVLSCIPSLPIMLILYSVFYNIKDVSKLYYMMMVLCLIGWVGTARLVRGQILSLREQEFMLAAKASGLSTASKMFKHLLPNVIPQLIVSMTLGLGNIILMEATLGFLGIGAPADTPTWGNLINLANEATYRQYYPNLWVGAGICITLAILAFNFVGDGLRDAFDPKMKR
ncbi:MAG: ABC transporter permease [Candidatus Coproplasma sp.]